MLSAAGTVLLLAGLLPASAAPVLADSSVQSLPFSQNWNDTSLITSSDDWSGVPGIVGYRGDGMAAVAGVDPQTILADGSATPVDVNANVTNPSTFQTGGVTEAEIADPTIALQGSGTARAPHLVIAVSTAGLAGITVAYNLRDIDGSSDNTTMALALQFRVGSTGNYTNVPAGFVADASQGGTATLVTPVSAQLPVEADNQPLVDVRILMTDAASTDEMIGVDDISITGTSGDAAPTVASTSPASGATGVAITTTPQVTFSEDVALSASGVTLTCANQGAKTIAISGGPSVYSLATPAFLNGDHCTLSIDKTAVSDTDAIDPPDGMDADFTISFDTAAAAPAIKVSEIYGGGGNAGATLKNDFIELYNPTASAASLAGWSVQYASATGATWQVTPLTGSIPAGRNYLVQEAAGAGGTVDLPSPDATGSISMAAAAGKVALVNSTVALGGTCPTGGAIVDFVGYGTTASCFEGTGPTSAPSNTTSVQRNGGGATDTQSNAPDFTMAAPDPHAGADQAPTVVSTFPANGATDVDVSANLTVTFSEPVNVTDPWFDLTCNSLPKPATSSGGPTTFTIDPVADFVDGDACSLTVIAANVADQDAVDPPDTMVMNFTVGFSAVDACVHTFTPIYDIQGSGATAAMTGNVTTAGVVVGDFEGGAAVSGFYLQDAAGDGDPATSDGIFVYTGGGNANTVNAGEFVRVTGFARERFNQTTINGADDNNAAVPAGGIVHCGTGSVAPTEVTMPFASTTFPERYEGMLVNFPQPLVISEYFNYARFGEIVLAQPLDGEDRPFTGTSVDEPGAAANARTAANAVRRITLDDNVSAQNPAVLRHPNGQPFSLTNRFRGGDTVANTTGILGFDFSLYRVYPTAPADYTAADPRPAAPENVGGTLRAAAMNTLNFFLTPDAIQDDSGADNPADNVCGGNANLECRGWDGDQPAEFDRQRDKLLQALAGLDADVIGLNELENTPGVEPLLDPTRGVVAGLNALPGVGPYDAIDTGVIGTDAIRVGIIYRSDVVRPVGAYKILDSTVDPRFIDTKNRPSVAQTFDVIATGARFTIVVNHLKSKGSDCNDVGDPDAGDGQGNCAGTREQAAKALVDWIATDPTGSGDRDYLILGDLNSYAMEDSVDAVKAGADDTAGTADDFTNLIAKYQGPFAHSYVFDGQSGYLDHALASATLIGQVTGAADWHINSDEPAILDYDTTFKPPAQEALYEPNQYRTSDHDPVVVGLNLLSYHFNGFEAPVDNPPTQNIAKAGQSVPVKFHLAGDLGLGVLFGTPFAMQHTCGGGGPSDAVDATNPGGSGLQFDPVSGTYTYVWKTDKNWTNQCRTFEITFDDGTYRRAEFSFTK